MAIFSNMTLTERGETLLNRAIGEEKILVFTKIKLGKGELSSGENVAQLIDIKIPFKEVGILETNVLPQKTLKIIGYFDNTGFVEDILWKEVGVFAKIKDEPESEILYSYVNAGTAGEIIPMEKKGKFGRTLNILNYIGYASSVTFEITEIKDKYAFNTTNEMKAATFLKEGDKVELWGNDILGDEPIGLYIIGKTNQNGIQLVNSLYANYYNYINSLTDEEVDTLLNFDILDEVFTLATERDIRNLFVGTRLEGGTEYKLSALSPDETKMVNMKLLSLFNDLILQKVANDSNTLKSNLEAALNLKEDKTKVAELLSSLETKLNNLINQKADTARTITGSGSLTGGGDLSTDRVISHKTSTGHKHIPSGGSENQFLKWLEDGTATWSEIAWEIIANKTSIIVGTGLTGGGNIGNNININIETLNDSEVDTLLNTYKK